MMTRTLAIPLLAACLWRVASALDIEIDSYECSGDYSVTADVYLEGADGSSRGTFGEQIRLYGDLYFSNVENSGIEDNVAYLSAQLSLFSIDFNLVSMQRIPLCYDPNDYNNNQEGADEQAEGADYYDNGEGGEQADYYDQADEANAEADYYDNAAADNGARRRLQDGYENCPADGTYSFSVDYVLPSAGRESASWLASGWSGDGVIEMFAQRNENMKIGRCVLTLSTYVTPEDSDSLIKTPSAAATAGIVLAVLAATLLMCLYCYCCSSRKSKDKDSAKTVVHEDAISTFRRMDDDGNMSKPGTITVDAGASQAESKKSSGWKPWVSLGGEADDASKQPV